MEYNQNMRNGIQSESFNNYNPPILTVDTNMHSSVAYPNPNYQNMPSQTYETQQYPSNSLATEQMCYQDQGQCSNLTRHVNIFNAKEIQNIYSPDIYQQKSEIFSSTLNILPSSTKLQKNIRIPIGLITTPFSSDASVHIAGRGYLIRCKYCSSYLNPYCKIIDDKTYTCSVCTKRTSIGVTSNEMIEALKDRPEHKYNTIEYDSDLSNRPVPPPLNMIFLLDSTYVKNTESYIDIVTETIKNNIDKIVCDKRATITIITFDSFINMYEVHSSNNETYVEHIIVTDLDEAYQPSFENSSIRFKTNNHLQYLLDKLPEIIGPKSSNDMESCFTCALEFAVNLLYKVGGGRVTAFVTSPPTLGKGVYKPRFQTVMVEGDKEESAILLPDIDYYNDFGMESLHKNVTIDLFYLSKEPIDLANLLPMCQLTGGEMFIAPNVKSMSHQNREWLRNNLEVYISRELRLEAQVKLRMSESFQVSNYYGNFFTCSVKKTCIPIMNQYTTLAFQLNMEYDLPKILPYTCFQLSVLSSSPDGSVKLRVSTISINISDFYQDIFSSINATCLLGILSRMACERSFQYSIHDTRTSIINAVVDLIKSYHNSNMTILNYDNFVVPAPVSQFTVLMYCLLKFDAFTLQKKVRSDKRILKLVSLRTWPSQFLLEVLHPKLYDLTELMSQAFHMKEQFPYIYHNYSLPCTLECIFYSKVYILDTGLDLYIYISPDTSDYLINSLLGLTDYQSMPDVIVSLPKVSHDVNIFMHYMIYLICLNRPYKPNIIIFKDDCVVVKKKFLNHLILDKTDRMSSYQEWIRGIRNRLVQIL